MMCCAALVGSLSGASEHDDSWGAKSSLVTDDKSGASEHDGSHSEWVSWGSGRQSNSGRKCSGGLNFLVGTGEVEWRGRSDSSCSNRIRVGRSGSQAPDPWCLEAIVMLNPKPGVALTHLRVPCDCGGRDRPSFSSLGEAPDA